MKHLKRFWSNFINGEANVFKITVLVLGVVGSILLTISLLLTFPMVVLGIFAVWLAYSVYKVWESE